MDTIYETFGRRSIWLAVKQTDKEKIKSVLSLKDTKTMDWSTGMQYACKNNNYIMITEPYSGWNFVVGKSLPELYSNRFTMDWLKKISEKLKEVYYFESHRTVGLAGFAIAKKGILERVYCYLGDQGTVKYNYGEITKAENKLNFNFAPNDDLLFEDGFTDCDDEAILQLAGVWTINPDDLEGKPANDVICGKIDL